MAKKNTGKGYEELTERIFKMLYQKHGNAEIFRNVMMESVDAPRQIDVLIKVKIADLVHNIIIECRDFNKKLSIPYIDGFVSKMQDVKASHGILVSPKGFAKAAISKAKRFNITLYTLEESGKPGEYDMSVKVLVRQITFDDFKVYFGHVDFDKQSLMKTYLTSDMIVNDAKISDVITRTWENPTFDVNGIKDGEEFISYEGLKPPYIIRQPFNGSFIVFEFESFEFSITCSSKYYIVDFDEVDQIHILKNLFNNDVKMFFPMGSIYDYVKSAIPVTKHEADKFVGLRMVLRSHLKIGTTLDINMKFPI